MLIELATLPPIIQQYITQSQSVEFKLIDNGQVLATPTQRVERPFNFEIDEIDNTIQSGFTPPIPSHALTNVETFEKWLQGV